MGKGKSEDRGQLLQSEDKCPSRPSSKCSQLGRAVFLAVASFALIGLVAWTISIYTFKVIQLQDRVTELEKKHIELEEYIEVQLEALIEKVGLL